jgi:hypothetical protein
MPPLLQRPQTVDSEPGRTAPDHYVSMGHWDLEAARTAIQIR